MVNLDVAAVYGQRQNSAELGVQNVQSGVEEVTFKVHRTIPQPGGAKRKTWISAGVDSLEHAGALAYRCAIWAAGLSGCGQTADCTAAECAAPALHGARPPPPPPPAQLLLQGARDRCGQRLAGAAHHRLPPGVHRVLQQQLRRHPRL